MATKNTIDRITEILRSSDLSWLLPNLRQDGMVWKSLNDPAFLDKFSTIKSTGENYKPEDFSPCRLALIALDQENAIDTGQVNVLDLVSDQVLQAAMHSYPELIISGPGPKDLAQAGLVALALANQYQQTGTWQDLIHALPEGDALGWLTPITCLFGMMVEPNELLRALVQADAHTLRYRLSIHTIMSNPMASTEQVSSLSSLWDGMNGDILPPADRVRFLEEVYQQDPQIASDLCKNWLNKHPREADEIIKARGSWPQLFMQLAEVMFQIQAREYANIPDDLSTLRSIQESLSHNLYANLVAQMLDPGSTGSIRPTPQKYPEARFVKTIEIANEILPVIDSPNIQAEMALAFNQQGLQEAALAHLTHADETQADTLENLYANALLASQAGDRQRANQAATRLFEQIDRERVPDDIPVWGKNLSLSNLGKLLLELHRAHDAAHILELAVQRCPNDPALLGTLAESYSSSSQGQLAADTYCVLVSLHPRNLEYRRKFAGCLSNLEQWDACLNERSFIVESSSADQHSSNYQDLYDYALAALRANRPDLAMNTCKDILVNNPDDIQALIYLGKAQIAIHQVDNGMEALTRATQISPQSVEAWLALAEAQKEQSDLKTAISTLINATMLVPNAPQLLFALGDLYLQDNAPTLALPELERAVELAPDEALTLVTYGKALILLGHAEKAQQVFANAYRLEPDFPDLALMYSKILISMGKVEDAIAPLDLLVNNKQTRDPEIYLDYARCILTVNKIGVTAYPPMKALIALNEAMQIAPEMLEAKALTAEVLFACNENELAYQAYHDALETELKEDKTWFERLSFGLGCTASAIGKFDVAIAALQEAGQINPNNPSIFKALSDAYFSADFPEDGARAARNVLVIDGENADQLSWFARQMNRLMSLYPQVYRNTSGGVYNLVASEILSALNKAIQLAPTRIDLLIQLGNFQSSSGAKDEAVFTLASISALDFATVNDLISAAEHLSKLGDHQEAIHCLEKALSVDLKNTDQHDPALYKNLAYEYMYSQDHACALGILDKAIELIPEDRSILKLKVEYLLGLGNPGEALLCIENATQNAPGTNSDVDLYFLAARINRAFGNLSAAVDFARRAVKYYLPAGKPLNLSKIPMRHRVMLAELYRMLLQPQQAYSLLASERLAEGEDFENELEYLDYLLMLAELGLETGKPVNPRIPELQMDQSHPFSIRLAALKARLVNRSGDSEQAAQVLQYAANKVNMHGQGFTGWEAPYYEYQQALSMCEAALEIGEWGISSEHTEKIISLAKDEPQSMLVAAKGIILKAEFSRLCDTFDVVEHKPEGQVQGHDQLNECQGYLDRAQGLLNNYRQEALVPDLGMNDDQTHRWTARARIVFHNTSKSMSLADASETLSQSGHIEDLPALVRCYHLQALADPDSDALTKIIKITRAYPGEAGIVLHSAQAFQDTSPESAMRSLQAVLEQHCSIKNPSMAFCNILLARIAASMHDLVTAGQAMEAALAIWPNESRWHAQVAQTYADHREVRNAIGHLIEATQLAPAELCYQLQLGELYLENANDDRNVLTLALKCFETALALDPDQVNVLIDLASTQYSLNDIENANDNARRALLISPDRAEIYQLLSAIAIRNNDYQGAYEYANKALLISPKDVQSVIVLAKSLSALGRHHEAIAKLNAAISDTQQPERLYLERVNILFKMAGARAALTELIALNNNHPDNFDILNALSRMHAEAGEYENAVGIAQQALESSTEKTSTNEQANIHLLLGQIFRKSGRLDPSIQHLNEAIRLAPDRLEPYLELGLARKERREFQQALQIFEQATNIAPNDPRAPFQAGLALKESKDYKSSETMLRRAVSLAPNDLSIRRQLAAVVALNLVHNPRIGRS